MSAATTEALSVVSTSRSDATSMCGSATSASSLTKRCVSISCGDLSLWFSIFKNHIGSQSEYRRSAAHISAQLFREIFLVAFGLRASCLLDYPLPILTLISMLRETAHNSKASMPLPIGDLVVLCFKPSSYAYFTENNIDSTEQMKTAGSSETGDKGKNEALEAGANDLIFVYHRPSFEDMVHSALQESGKGHQWTHRFVNVHHLLTVPELLSDSTGRDGAAAVESLNNEWQQFCQRMHQQIHIALHPQPAAVSPTSTSATGQTSTPDSKATSSGAELSQSETGKLLLCRISSEKDDHSSQNVLSGINDVHVPFCLQSISLTTLTGLLLQYPVVYTLRAPNTSSSNVTRSTSVNSMRANCLSMCPISQYRLTASVPFSHSCKCTANNTGGGFPSCIGFLVSKSIHHNFSLPASQSSKSVHANSDSECSLSILFDLLTFSEPAALARDGFAAAAVQLHKDKVVEQMNVLGWIPIGRTHTHQQVRVEKCEVCLPAVAL